MSSSGKKRILVVDDEPDFVWMIRSRLEAGGFAVSTAKDGKEALAKFEAESPQAVLLDIYIPGAGGLTVLRMIRRRDKDVPVFMLTASQDKKDFFSAKRYGASGFIAKTSNLRKEMENVESALRLSLRSRKGAP